MTYKAVFVIRVQVAALIIRRNHTRSSEDQNMNIAQKKREGRRSTDR
jgi:hypothetical protein